MIFYYALEAGTGKMHIVLKKAFEEGMSNKDYVAGYDLQDKYQEFLNVLLSAGATQLSDTIFGTTNPQNIIIAAGLKGHKMTMKPEILTKTVAVSTHAVNPKLPVIYYDFKNNGSEQQLAFEFKKYYDQGDETGYMVFDDSCSDYDDALGMSREYHNFDNNVRKVCNNYLIDDEDQSPYVLVKNASNVIAGLKKLGYNCIKKQFIV